MGGSKSAGRSENSRDRDAWDQGTRRISAAARGEGESSQLSPERLKVPTLVVRKGKTDANEYVLTGNLTVIGNRNWRYKAAKWFAPAAAAQIIRRNKDLSLSDLRRRKGPKRQWKPHHAGRYQLISGDIIDVAGVTILNSTAGPNRRSLRKFFAPGKILP